MQRLLVVVGCSKMDDISVNIGELFEDVNHRNDKNKLKPNHEIQKVLAENFQKLTGFSVPHSRFLNVCKTYVNKIKSNKKLQINLLISFFIFLFFIHC